MPSTGPWLRQRNAAGSIVYGPTHASTEPRRSTVVVSVGCNTSPTHSLDPDRWAAFKVDVSLTFGTAPVFTGEGQGWYEAGNYAERSYTAVWSDVVWSEAERTYLGALAKKYGQESIAVTVGQTEFVS